MTQLAVQRQNHDISSKSLSSPSPNWIFVHSSNGQKTRGPRIGTVCHGVAERRAGFCGKTSLQKP
jgi:hypothetical protein